jgi:hypothetical protein
MRRLLTGLAGAIGVAALWRLLTRQPPPPPPPPPSPPSPPAPDPAEELRQKLAEARETEDDRDEFDAAEGTPVDQVEEPRSLEERRRAVHEQAQEALGRMHQQDAED